MSTVSELHLECVCTGCSSEKLMAKANAENGRTRLLECSGDVIDRLFHHCRISGSVRQEQAIVIFSGQLREVVVPGYDLYFNASIDEAPELVELKTDVDADDTHESTRRMIQRNGRIWRISLWLWC